MKVDKRFVIKVSDYMRILNRPAKRLVDNDGSILPLITVEVGLWTI